MKRLVSWLMSGVLMAGLLLSLIIAPAAQADSLRNIADDKISERGDKIDLNNCSVRRFQAFPGMYPTLAGKIVLGGPYNSVDDLFDLDLTDRQKELVEKFKGDPRKRCSTSSSRTPTTQNAPTTFRRTCCRTSAPTQLCGGASASAPSSTWRSVRGMKTRRTRGNWQESHLEKPR